MAPDSYTATPRRPVAIVAPLLLPPYGLFLLWKRRGGLVLKLLGTVGLLLVSLAEAALVIFLMVRFTGLEIEWRGGYLPALTYRKSRPNYDVLERDLARTSSADISAGLLLNTNAYWTGFRGPQADGSYAEQPILTNWPADGLRLVWRRPIGGGYSSFAIAHGLAFTLEQRREREAAVAYELASGREVWRDSWSARFKEYYSEEGPRSTPACSEGKAYFLGAVGHLRCLDIASGKLVWGTNLVEMTGAKVPTYAFSASPVVLGEKLIVLAGGPGGKSVICFEKTSGKVMWTTLDDRVSYATPLHVTLAGHPQLLICTASRVVGLKLEDGTLLWDYPWRPERGPAQIAQPVLLGTNRFLISAGYFTGCAAVEVTKAESGWSAKTVWQNKYLKNKFTSSVYWQGHIYGLDEDILTCLDAATGERKWKAGRYGYGQLALADGHLVILSGSGELALVRANPDRHVEIARFAAIKGKTWNHLAFGEGNVVVRNSSEMACYPIAE